MPSQKKETDSTFPLETPCFQIDELVLSNDFLDDRGLNKIKKQVAGKCLGMNGLKKNCCAFSRLLYKCRIYNNEGGNSISRSLD